MKNINLPDFNSSDYWKEMLSIVYQDLQENKKQTKQLQIQTKQHTVLFYIMIVVLVLSGSGSLWAITQILQTHF